MGQLGIATCPCFDGANMNLRDSPNRVFVLFHRFATILIHGNLTGPPQCRERSPTSPNSPRARGPRGLRGPCGHPTQKHSKLQGPRFQQTTALNLRWRYNRMENGKTTRRRISRKPKATVFWCIYIAIHGHLLHLTTFTPGTLYNFYTRHLLHQTPSTPDTFYTRHLLHQTTFTTNNFYTRHPLHQKPFTPDTFYTKHLWHQTPFTPNKFYNKQLLHQAPFTIFIIIY